MIVSAFCVVQRGGGGGYPSVHFSLHVDANWIVVRLLILEHWC